MGEFDYVVGQFGRSRIRSHFEPVQNVGTGDYINLAGSFTNIYELGGNSGEVNHTTMQIPSDFETLTNLELIIIGVAGGGNIQYSAASQWGNNNEAFNNHVDALPNILTGTPALSFFHINQNLLVDAAPLTIGDILSIQLTEDAVGLNDINIVGWWLEYLSL